MSLKLAFCLFAYRPFRGLQRDFFHIARACAQRGHAVVVYTMEWRGPIPADFDVHLLPARQRRNHARSKGFAAALARETARRKFDVVTGFNRIPGLDVYFAADPCYAARVRELHGPLYRLSSRYRHFAAAEQAIFGPEADTRILLLSEAEIKKFCDHYQTRPGRFRLLPPGISHDRRAPADAAVKRADFRHEHGVGEDERVVLLVGSGFRTKGLDRAIRALAGLPPALRQRSRLLVVGEDNARPFRRLARRLGIAGRVHFMQGRADVQRFMLGSDLLLHPARSELAGMVLLEAVIAGLPVLATDVCGYAAHVDKAAAGCIVKSPFSQRQMNRALAGMLDSPLRHQWSANGIRYGREQDLYRMPEVVADHIEAFSEQRW
jgi:UDP-glucose:(heptosyl)LPS alpha-1,3-glucosyltransferase